jgi:hypothetical protein
MKKWILIFVLWMSVMNRVTAQLHNWELAGGIGILSPATSMGMKGGVSYNPAALWQIQLGYNYRQQFNFYMAFVHEHNKKDDIVDYPPFERYESTRNIYTFLLGVNVSYLNTAWFTIYSGASAGLTFQHTVSEPRHYVEDKQKFAYHLNFASIRIGKELGVYGGVGWGYRGLFNCGIQYRF